MNPHDPVPCESAGLLVFNHSFGRLFADDDELPLGDAFPAAGLQGAAPSSGEGAALTAPSCGRTVRFGL